MMEFYFIKFMVVIIAFMVVIIFGYRHDERKRKEKNTLKHAIRNSIYMFLENNRGNLPLSTYGITRITTEDIPNGVMVNIYAMYPGYVIGRRGKLINELCDYLSTIYEMIVEVKIHEYNPFK